MDVQPGEVSDGSMWILYQTLLSRSQRKDGNTGDCLNKKFLLRVMKHWNRFQRL